MELWLAAIVFGALMAAFIAQRLRGVRRVREAEQSIARGQEVGPRPKGERSAGRRRAEGLRSRPPKGYIPLKVIGGERTHADVETYRAAYELIVRGIDVKLEMADVSREFGGAPMAGLEDIIAPHVSSRMTYTTAAFAPHLNRIESIADFQQYAPYRRDHEMWLSVHPDDLQETYVLLRELKIRLSALHHPDQMWWTP